jgi:microcystin-dependent protein
MTVSNPPIFLQSELHPAEDVRRWISSSVGGVPGVDAQESLRVTPNGTPNMTVVVAAGGAYVQGSENLYQGMYFTDNRGASSVTIQAADGSNDRIDFVVVHIKDSEYSGSDNEVVIEAITGTPAPIPVAPAIPENSLLLARVAVNAGATSITSSMLTDERTFIEVASKGYVDGLLPVGMMVDFGGPTAPTNWLMCDGTVYDRSQHPGLFDVIGTAYNTGGESSVQFRVPDYRNAVAIGPGDYALGAAGGSKDAALPAHTHTMGTHKHTMGTHTHAGGAHSHGIGTHTHSVNEHKHTADHEHGTYWSGDGGAHSHDTISSSYGGGAFGQDGAMATGNTKTGLSLGSAYTAVATGTAAAHSHYVTIPKLGVGTSKVSLTTNSGGNTSTNSAGAGTTGSTDPGDTSTTDPGDTNSRGVAPDGLNYPPFMTANKIIKAV